MAVTTTQTNKPLNPRGNDQSPKGYNRAELYSGKALDFDGVNDYVGITSATDLWTGDFSVSWYGDLDVTGNQFAFSSGTYTGSGQAGINFWYGGASTLNFSVHFPETDGTGQQGYNLTLSESYKYWHRLDLVFVSSSRLLSLYQNGILVDTATIASNVDAAYMPNGWEFGRSYGGSFPLNGKLTNLKAFNTALTAAQVADLYNNPEKVVPTGVADSALKLWLPMQEGAGTTCINGVAEEEITNGDFSDGTTGWTITNGSVTGGEYVSGTLTAYQGGIKRTSFSKTGTFIVQFDLEVTSGSIRIDDGGGVKTYSTSGRVFHTSTNPTKLEFNAYNLGFNGTIDNVSVIKVGGVISGATWTHGVGAPVAQTSVIDWNKHTLDGTNEVLIPQGLTCGNKAR